MGKIYEQLSIEERTKIQMQLEDGVTPAAIALGLNRSPSTISRELRRNNWTRPKTRCGPGRPPVAGGYRSEAAHKRARACTVIPRMQRRLQPGTALWEQVMGYLKRGYSPEQISGTLRIVHPETPTLQVSHETIYTAIYAMPRGELRKEVIGWLRFGHTKRRPRVRGEDRRGRIPDMVSIHDRPPEVEERLVPGHWEGDLIKGAGNRSAVGTLVERTTLFTVLSGMENASAEAGAERIQSRVESDRGANASFSDLRSGPGNGGTSTTDGCHRGEGLLCRPAQPLAARAQRKHQRFVAAVLAQGERFERTYARRAGRDRVETEHPTTQVAGLQMPRRAFHSRRF